MKKRLQKYYKKFIIRIKLNNFQAQKSYLSKAFL